MISCHIIGIQTPQKVLLNGLWFGTRKPKRVIVWVHGLGSSLFSMNDIVGLLADGETAVLVFNNRGYGVINRIRRGKKKVMFGAAHEVFTDCVDDIQGAVDFARRQGVKNIFLAGHSTGCQKSMYWAAKKKGRGVKGIILLAPIADYAGLNANEKKLRARAAKAARALVFKGMPHTILPNSVWPVPLDAQRFLSLYTPDSIEQSIFSYFDESKNPRLLRAIRTPLLVLLAEKDEYADRPAQDIAAWFGKYLHAPNRIAVIPDTEHDFRGKERYVADMVRKWIRNPHADTLQGEYSVSNLTKA